MGRHGHTQSSVHQPDVEGVPWQVGVLFHYTNKDSCSGAGTPTPTVKNSFQVFADSCTRAAFRHALRHMLISHPRIMLQLVEQVLRNIPLLMSLIARLLCLCSIKVADVIHARTSNICSRASSVSVDGTVPKSFQEVTTVVSKTEGRDRVRPYRVRPYRVRPVRVRPDRVWPG